MAIKGKRRADVWIENDKFRQAVCEYVSANPHTSSRELSVKFNIPLHGMQHQMRRLRVEGYVVRHGTLHLATYTRTNKKYTRKYPDGFIDYAAIRNGLIPRGITHEEPEDDEQEQDTRTVIRVNQHTTIYMNSKKPSTPISSEHRTKRKVVHTGIRSGMGMFEGW